MSLENSGYWMKLAEASYHLGLSEITIRRKIKAGKVLHELRDGKYYIYLKKDPEGELHLLEKEQNQEALQEWKEKYQSTLQENNILKKMVHERDKQIKELKRILEDQETLICYMESLQNSEQISP